MVYPVPFEAPLQNSSCSVAPTASPITAEILLAEAIDRLSPDGKLVLSLHYVDQLTMEEVAEVLRRNRQDVEFIHAAAITQLHESSLRTFA